MHPLLACALGLLAGIAGLALFALALLTAVDRFVDDEGTPDTRQMTPCPFRPTIGPLS
jgi:hypothetical protein